MKSEIASTNYIKIQMLSKITQKIWNCPKFWRAIDTLKTSWGGDGARQTPSLLRQCVIMSTSERKSDNEFELLESTH